VLLAGLALGVGLWVGAGRAEGPTVEIHQPTRFIGQIGQFEASVDTGNGELLALTAHLTQGELSIPLFSLATPEQATVNQESESRFRVTRALTREDYLELSQGPATVVVEATRAVLFGLRQATSTAQHDIVARFEPPRLSVVSSLHYVNLGGAEVIVYRVTPPDAESGVRVADLRFPGYPASAAGVEGADESLRVSTFALLHDQELNSPMRLYARDEAGNEAEIDFDHRVFPRRFRRSRIPLSDRFLSQVVPEIVERSEELRRVAMPPDAGLLEQYLAINGGLRQLNRDRLLGLAAETAETKLWSEPFRQLGNSQVESGFADYRTYVYDGRDVDQQVHLGFDLAATANVPIASANAGRVIFADYFGIYGNCVIVDHGLGLQSLYAHLSSLDVQVGDAVTAETVLGRSGTTGLAGGDHLHFAMLLHGRPVTPMEWWDPNWIEDRINRKLRAVN